MTVRGRPSATWLAPIQSQNKPVTWLYEAAEWNAEEVKLLAAIRKIAMTINPVRRQVLRAVGGLLLAPVSVGLPADGHGTCGHVLHQVQLDLLAAHEEGALLQIDWNDLRDVLTAMGNAPPCVQCFMVLMWERWSTVRCAVGPTPRLLNAVGGGQWQPVTAPDHCRAVFAVVTDAMVNSASTKASESNATITAKNRLQSGLNTPPMVCGVVVEAAAIFDGLRVTVLAG